MLQPAISSGHAFRLLVSQIWATYPRRISSILGLGLIKSITEGSALLALLPVLALIGIDSPMSNGIAQQLSSILERTGIQLNLALGLGFVVALGCISALVSFIQAAATAGLVRRFVRDLQIETYSRTIEANIYYLVRQKLGESIGMLMKFTEQTGNGISILMRASTDILVSLVLFGVAIGQSAAYVGVVVGIASLAAIPLVWHYRRIGRMVATAHNQIRVMTATIGDHLRLAFTIKAFGAQAESRKYVAEEISRSGRLLERLTIQVALARSLIEPGVLALLCLAIWTGVEIFTVHIDRLLILVMVFIRLMPRLIALSNYAQQSIGFLNAYAQLLDAQNEAVSATLARGSRIPDWRVLSRNIIFEGVTVRENDDTLLTDVNATIPHHGITAILGPSGAGKSTLMAVLLGLIQPTDGHVAVEGVDLSTVRGEAWRKRIGFVGQESPLFHESLRENLAFAAPQATDKDMSHALAQVGLDAFLKSQPQGLATIVGEGGSRMSGGERQRFALARALLRRPLLLVLDEPTSSLDWQTTENLLGLIISLSSSVPVVLVTHDLHLARIAQLIYVLDNGRIIEQGSWADLSGGDGRFSALQQTRSAG